MKVSFVLAVIGMTALLVLPEAVYIWIFDQDISGVKTIMLFLAPGVVAMSCNAILTHHFSGTGRHKVGMYASLVALAFMIVMNLILIPIMGMNGAAIATSAAFIAQTLYHVIVFQKEDDIRMKDYLIDGNDIKRGREIIGRLITNGSMKIE